MTTTTTPSAPDSDNATTTWLKRVPLLTGVLAALAGYLTVRGTNLANEAVYHSNQGVLFQAQASDAWAEYQAASVKARIVETVMLAMGTPATPDAREKLAAEAKDLRERQPPARAKAEGFEKQRDGELKFGSKRLSERDMLAYAGMATQLAIALASVAALTRRREAFVVALFVGLAGIAITGYAMILHYLAR